jgi:ABC-type Zn uptake system ZnuABC Zn-binding protein ZnuA
VAGDRAEVRALIPVGADPHDYDLRPSDVDALARADVVIRSGGDLDEWLGEALESAAADAGVVTLIDHVKTREGGAHGHEDEEHADEQGHAGEGDVDPHWWQDPRNAVLAVGAIRDAMATADADGASAYRTSANRYADRIRHVDAAVARCVGGLPAERRKLVTTHDALGYYAARYDIDVIGAVIPFLSTQGQASVGETAELVKTIRRERVRAIFAESSLDSRVERAIARDAGARIGAPLYSDTLGPGLSGRHLPGIDRREHARARRGLHREAGVLRAAGLRPALDRRIRLRRGDANEPHPRHVHSAQLPWSTTSCSLTRNSTLRVSSAMLRSSPESEKGSTWPQEEQTMW